MNELTTEELTKNWNRWPLSAIPLDKQIIAMWKSSNGRWKSGKFHGYEFYGRRSWEPFNDISVRWIYANRQDEIADDK